MKNHTNNFKSNIKEMGRELKATIEYGLTTLEEELYNIKFSYDGNMLKSVMKCLEVESSTIIPKDTVFDFQLGLKVGNSYEYLDYGNFVVKDIEKIEDTDHYKITCYDKILYSMKNYEAVDVQFPVTIREYIGAICDDLNIDFANENDEFANYDRELLIDPYDGLDYTYRDILDELAEVTASVICINDSDELEIRYPSNSSVDTINENFLKDVNVEFGEKYGPINSIVLSRSAESDNVFLQDGESVATNGLCEIKIIDNQIMNFNDRSDYLPDILEKLDELEYYINDYSSTGICYLELLDKYNVSIRETTYNCLMLNDEINVNQGLEELIYAEMPEQSETDYTKADKTDQRINQAYIIVDKQNQKIESLTSQIGDRSQKTTTVTQDIDGLEIAVSDIEDLTLEVAGANPLTLTNCLEGEIVKFTIKGNNTVFEGLKPGNLPPRTNMVPMGDSILLVKHYDENNLVVSTDTFNLGITEPLRQYSNTVYDELVYDYEDENSKWKVIRRVGVENGVLYPLSHNIITTLDLPDILLTKGKNVIDIGKPYTASCYARYIQITGLTSVFATTYEVESFITQLANSITLLVREKVGKEEIIAELNVAIQEGQGIVKIIGNQVIIDSDYFHLTANGEITATKGTIGGWNLTDVSLYRDIESDGDIIRSGLYASQTANQPFFYCGLEPDANISTAKFHVNHNGDVSAENIKLNGQTGYVYVNFDNGYKAMSLRWDGLYRYLSNGNFWSKLGTIFNGSVEQGEGIFLQDALYFSVYDSLHSSTIAKFSRIGNQGEAARVDFYASGYINGYQIQTAQSDARIKDNIEDSEIEALPIINELNMRQFDWNKEKSGNEGHIDVGFIAQEVEEVYDKLVIHSINPDNDTYGIDLLNTLALSVKAIQELSKKVDDLENEINKLKGEN